MHLETSSSKTSQYLTLHLPPTKVSLDPSARQYLPKAHLSPVMDCMSVLWAPRPQDSCCPTTALTTLCSPHTDGHVSCQGTEFGWCCTSSLTWTVVPATLCNTANPKTSSQSSETNPIISTRTYMEHILTPFTLEFWSQPEATISNERAKEKERANYITKTSLYAET